MAMAALQMGVEEASNMETARVLYSKVLEAITDMGGRAWADEVTDYIRETQGHTLTRAEKCELSSIVQIALCKAVGKKELVYNGYYQLYSEEALETRERESHSVPGTPIKLKSIAVLPQVSPTSSRQ